MIEGWGFNPPPYWPKPPENWTPPAGWLPDPAWGPVPPGWQLWIPARRRRRRAMTSIVGLVAVAGLAALAVIVPRTEGPGAADPRTGGVALNTGPLPVLLVPSASAGPTPAVTSVPHRVQVRTYRSCAELNRVYPGGVGMPDAVDRTTGRPVADFGRSIAIYRANLRYDRDGDGIACEPR